MGKSFLPLGVSVLTLTLALAAPAVQAADKAPVALIIAQGGLGDQSVQ